MAHSSAPQFSSSQAVIWVCRRPRPPGATAILMRMGKRHFSNHDQLAWVAWHPLIPLLFSNHSQNHAMGRFALSSRLGQRARDPIFRPMCGRVRLSSDVSEIKLVFAIPPHRPIPNIAPSWNAAPTDQLPIVRCDPRAGERSLDLARWGLVPFWAKDIKVGFANINAKAEGIESRPAFREAFQRRRCLVPVDNFYEWEKTWAGKQPYAIALADRGLMALAGLWENWRSSAGMGPELRHYNHDAE